MCSRKVKRQSSRGIFFFSVVCSRFEENSSIKTWEEVREKKSSVVDLVSSFPLFMLCYLVLLMVVLCCSSWQNLRLFFSFCCLQICGNGDGGLGNGNGAFHNSTTVVFILDSMFLMLLFFSVALLLLVVAFYCFIAPYGFALPLLVVKLYCSSWSRFATPRGRTLLFFLVVTLCYFLWSSFAAPCGHALLLLVVNLYCFEV